MGTFLAGLCRTLPDIPLAKALQFAWFLGGVTWREKILV